MNILLLAPQLNENEWAALQGACAHAEELQGRSFIKILYVDKQTLLFFDRDHILKGLKKRMTIAGVQREELSLKKKLESLK